MFKNLIILALVAVIVVGILFIWSGNAPEAPADESAAAVAVAEPEPFTGTGDFAVVVAESVLRWEGRKPLLPNNYTDGGTVGVKNGTIRAEKGLVKSGRVAIDLNTITALSTGKGTGEDLLSKNLKSADFFDVAKYPTAELVIESGTPDATDPALQTVVGILTVKGVTQPISFPTKVVKEGEGLRATARVTLDRTIWNIRYGSGKFFSNLGDNLIADSFTVEFEVTALPVVFAATSTKATTNGS